MCGEGLSVLSFAYIIKMNFDLSVNCWNIKRELKTSSLMGKNTWPEAPAGSLCLSEVSLLMKKTNKLRLVN